MNTKFIAGLLAGVGAGTLIGLLIAPEKGTDTYKKLESSVKDAFNDLLDSSEKIISSAEKEARKVTSRASNN